MPQNKYRYSIFIQRRLAIIKEKKEHKFGDECGLKQKRWKQKKKLEKKGSRTINSKVE